MRPSPRASTGWPMSAGVARLIVRLARALPGDGFARMFEPSFEDLRAERRSRPRFTCGLVLLLADCYRLALWATLTNPRRRQAEPEAAAMGLMDSLVQDGGY